MYLKSLEMIGFKSFVDKTTLEFQRGFTAVVGPNGCGKSNISDAIRWVIGEQSSKSLRGSKMEDLVFKGSDARKALGMAEVSLTIANLPTSPANDSIPVAEEARITRRFYRSGESEYFINKTPCRLRDIIDLFLDTGISARAFSIIEQGHILQLVNSKPVERRFIIEEAAGIMKYKHRRNEALRKMSAAQENLVRVNDTMNELQKQYNSLKRQASKAEKYKEMKVELKDMTLSLNAADYRQYRGSFDEIAAAHEQTRTDKEKKETEHATIDNNMESLRVDATFQEKELHKLKQENLELEGTIVREEDRMDLITKQIQEAIRDSEKALEEITQLEEDKKQISQTLVDRQEELIRTDGEIVSLEGVFEEKNKHMTAIKEELDQAKSQMETIETDLQEMHRSITEDMNKKISMRTRLGVLLQQEEKIHEEEKELSGQMDDIHQQEIKAKERYESSGLMLSQQKEKQRETQALISEQREKLKNIESELEQKKDIQSRALGRLASLEELQKNFEGIQKGARNLLQKREKEESPEGIYGILAEMIETEPAYEVAIETVLGERLQGLIVENQQTSIEAIDYLKSNTAGRSTFIPLSPRKIERQLQFPESDSEIMGKALDLVRTNPKYQEVLNYLLEDVLIVKNMEKALALWENQNITCSLVTLEGDILSPQGVLMGGSPVGDESSLLRKKRIISELKSESEALSLEMEKINNQLLEMRKGIDDLEKEKKEIDEIVLTSEKQSIHDEKDLHQIQERINKDRQRLEACREQVKKILEEKENAEKEVASAELEIAQLESKKEGLEKESNSFKEKLHALYENLDEAKEGVNHCNVSLVSLKGKKDNLALDMERLRTHTTSMFDRIEKRKTDQEEANEKKLRLNETIESIKKEIIELSHRLQASKSVYIEKEESLKELLENLNQMEESFKEVSAELNNLRDQSQEQELKKAEIKLRLDNIQERITEDFDLGIEELLNEYNDEVNREECPINITSLKEKLSKFTDVNLGALEEYNVVKERYDFMKKQYDDLILSITDLNKAIEKINKTTSQRFAETFHKVNENFKMTFRRLFSGGRAEMVLTQPDDLLETGIEIVVQPPGKKQQNILMFSAGEKAMIALSILFSVFRVKPSPFCLLDEVDAPLDESNITRFKEILRELSDKTQFIIITHNQITMTFAETLYGVTMEEKGVSKIVSVNLEKKETINPEKDNTSSAESGPVKAMLDNDQVSEKIKNQIKENMDEKEMELVFLQPKN